MSLASAALPTDPDALRAFALACQQELAAASSELQAAKVGLQLRVLEIEKLKVQIARLRRMAFGRSSERLDQQIGQLELQLEELETGAAEVTGDEAAEPDVDETSAPIKRAKKPKRAPLPDHLPRETVVHEPAHDAGCTCTACGAAMGKLGEDVTEVLDYIPGRFRVIRHVRPKYACTRCDVISQAPVPNLPILRGRATPSLLAMIVVSKYLDHLPLYRQSEIYAREGVELPRSTLTDYVGQVAWLLAPIAKAIRDHVFAGEKIHGDDTPVPVLAPGFGRTRTGRLCWGGRPKGIECANIRSNYQPNERAAQWNLSAFRSTRPSMFLRSMESMTRNARYCGARSGELRSNRSSPNLHRRRWFSKLALARTIGGEC